MTSTPRSTGVPAELVEEGARLVAEALHVLPRVALLAQAVEALEYRLDAERTRSDDIEADDAMVETWGEASGVHVARALLMEMAVCVEQHLGSAAPDRPAVVAHPVARARRWLSEAAPEIDVDADPDGWAMSGLTQQQDREVRAAFTEKVEAILDELARVKRALGLLETPDGGQLPEGAPTSTVEP